MWWAAQTLSPFASNAHPHDSILAANGLSLDNAADRSLLASFSSSLSIQHWQLQRGFNKLPYPGFPGPRFPPVAQSLRPFPQFTGIVQTWNPLGSTWYDALQTKGDQAILARAGCGGDLHVFQESGSRRGRKQQLRFHHHAGDQRRVQPRQNNKTLSGFDQPQSLIISGSYTTPKVFVGASSFGGKVVSWAARDWTAGAVLHYASGFPFKVPTATTGLASFIFQGTNVNRVPGQPLFTVDLNCHCYDPNTTFALNPAAWANPPLGQFGTANAHYDDYRQQRRPSESVSLARTIRIKERATLQIRAEFSNIFNRAGINVPPSPTRLRLRPVRVAHVSRDRRLREGIGYISSAAVGGAASNPAAASTATFATPRPREGTLVARFTF